MKEPYPDGTPVTGLVGTSSIVGKVIGHRKYIHRVFQDDGVHLVSEYVEYTYTVQSDEEYIPYPRSMAEKSGTYECRVVILREHP